MLLIGHAEGKIGFNQSKSTTQIRLATCHQNVKFLGSFLRCHFAGKEVKALQNVGCLTIKLLYTVVRTFHNIFSQWAWKLVTGHCMFSSRFLLHRSKNTLESIQLYYMYKKLYIFSETSIKRTPSGPSQVST